MKPETNKEMDLLLRRLGRSAADSPADGGHLDADELSSYTENALPVAARARYTEHLAGCANCRKLVAQLSSSAGVVSVAETAKVSGPSALRTFLASLFSPLVLRYAVPALGLIVVAVIGFTVLRRNEDAPSVARLSEPEKKATPVQPAPVESPAPGAVATRGYIDSRAATPEPARGELSKAQPAPSQNAQAGNQATAPANEPAPVAKAEAPPPASSPAEAKPAATVDETQKKTEDAERKKEITTRSVSALPAQGAADSVKQREDRRSDSDFTAARAPAKTAGRGSVANLQVDGVDDKDKNESMRSVAGRRFRRERGMWIDTAYDSSRSTVNLTRGSEQYRALVADEPAIKTIADQLAGEIIVIWKGHAYRIQ